MLQVCNGARAEEDKATGAILKCLVSSVDSVSSTCARETGRAARNALTFYQPKAPVTDVCDSDVASLCLSTQGLKSMSVGQVCGMPQLSLRLSPFTLDQNTSLAVLSYCQQSFDVALLCLRA